MGETMLRVFVKFLLCCLFFIFCTNSFAGVGDSDNRYYVTEKMWATEPYKKFAELYLADQDYYVLGNCSSQFIAPNLILSAGHCTQNGALYVIKNYKGELIDVDLLKTAYTGIAGDLGDWAIFLVQDPKYYNDSFFNVKTPKQSTNVLNAGWGWVRILSNNDLKIIKKLSKSINANSAREYFDILSSKMKESGIEGLRDEQDRLKASKCKIVFEDCVDLANDKEPKTSSVCNNQTSLSKSSHHPKILATTCDSWCGNSGGGYVSLDNKNVYGVCSYGAYGPDEFSDATNTDYITASSQFLWTVADLKRLFPAPTTPQKPQDPQTPQPDDTKPQEPPKKPKSTCETRHPGASVKRLACCRAGYTTTWKGDEQEGICTCVDVSKQWEWVDGAKYGKCVAKSNSVPTEPEETKPTEPKPVENVPVETTPEQPSQPGLTPATSATPGLTPVVPVDIDPGLTPVNPGNNEDLVPEFPPVPIEQVVENLETEVDELNATVAEQIPNVSDLSDAGLLSFLGKLVEHQVKSERLEELKKKYEEAKAREQSLENRMLTAATVAAMGIGGMELAQGLAEQSADAAAERDMTAYIETMRCSYADGKSVKAGDEPIELPGGNDEIIMKLRNEYFALAADLKERKEALGMKPGIESEIVLDKANMGLYDEENVGITGGSFSSLYRAKMGSETDSAMITADKEKSENRVKGGGIAAGAGAVIGIGGNYLINGEKAVETGTIKDTIGNGVINEKINEIIKK